MQKSADWYNKEKAGLGNRFLIETVRVFKSITANPLHHEEKFAKKFRFARLSIFPYLVVYKVKGRLVIVNAVFHTSRNPKLFGNPKI